MALLSIAGVYWRDNYSFCESKFLRGSQNLPHRHFVARQLAGRSFVQGKIRHVKQIAFAIYLTGVLDGDFAPNTLEAHPQVDASVGSLRSQHGR